MAAAVVPGSSAVHFRLTAYSPSGAAVGVAIAPSVPV